MVDIAALFREGIPIDEAIQRGVDQVIERHRREGRPLVVWRNDRVTWIDATTFEEVPPPDDPPAEAPSNLAPP